MIPQVSLLMRRSREGPMTERIYYITLASTYYVSISTKITESFTFNSYLSSITGYEYNIEDDVC